LKNKDLLVGSFYIPHREHQHLDQLKLSLERSAANKQNIILVGDFNCPNINWEQQTATGPDREIQQELADLMSFHSDSKSFVLDVFHSMLTLFPSLVMVSMLLLRLDRSLCIAVQSVFCK
jgi:endonuclease/exonuclease/phosphatase family metal-dependent hydrolase